MGECGCSAYAPALRLPGPKGIVYTLSFYTGCKNCESPPGLIITRHNKQEAGMWGDHNTPEPEWDLFDFTGHDQVNAEACVKIVDMKVLKDAIIEAIKREDEGDEEDRHIPDDDGREWFVEDIFEELNGRCWWPGGVS